MRTAWSRAAILLAGALLAFAAAGWLIRSVSVRARLPQKLAAAQQALEAGGGEEGLVERQRFLSEMHARLVAERAAKSSNAERFSRRVGEAFEELGLAIETSSGWRPVPGFEGERSAVFARTLTGSGPFGALLDAVATLESWPDQARVRTLSVEPEAMGTVAFTIEIAAPRLQPGSADEES